MGQRRSNSGAHSPASVSTPQRASTRARASLPSRSPREEHGEERRVTRATSSASDLRRAVAGSVSSLFGLLPEEQESQEPTSSRQQSTLANGAASMIPDSVCSTAAAANA